MESYLKHYGTPRHSGRYPWGSGDNPHQSAGDFRSMVSDLRKQGLSDTDIAKGLGISRNQLQAQITLAREHQRKEEFTEAVKLKDKGYSTSEIARRMGKNESSIRSLLNPAIQERAEITAFTSNTLKDSVAEKGYIDVGLGVESHLGISKVKLNAALTQLKEEGYNVYYVKVEQLGTGKPTSIKVLCPPDTTYSELYKNRDKIRTITNWSEDGGRSYLGLKPPLNIDSKRIEINYAETGGKLKDGVIELRRGVSDISLGDSKYAQVRIAVDGTHYLKGMAIYSDNLPDGVDIRFNTNKNDTGDKHKAMKALKDDPDNPFGSSVRQITDPKTGKVISALNIVGLKEGAGEEGSWDTWSRSLSSQFLSKQSPSLAKKQLTLDYDIRLNEQKDILALTNPVVKKQLLEAFADNCDAASVHLKGAALPRQASKVILPITSMKENEIYAPSFNNGEIVVLIRHPHGGTFEIPQLIVNNKSKEAQSIMKGAKDAVGINPKVAQRLSGADFDGDTVIVIPNVPGRPTSVIVKPPEKMSASLRSLENFDPITLYKNPDNVQPTAYKNGKWPSKQAQMGSVSNLITDMTIKGATDDEIARAVKHSMVVIDAEKHNLNYRQSAIDNGIPALKAKYQGGPTSGASTLISRAGSEIRVNQRVERAPDPLTGKRTYVPTGETYVSKKGVVLYKTDTTTKMAEEENAFALSSGTRMEGIYASYANQMKALANDSRKAAIAIKAPGVSSSAKTTYANEVASLQAKLKIALMNKPLERQAQILANSIVQMKKEANPYMDKDELKKIKNQALASARITTGASKKQIEITDREWEAIQSHAISSNVLTQILQNTDIDKVKQKATPRTTLLMSSAKVSRAKSMLDAGYTQAEVAEALGVSTTTLMNSIQS